MTEAAPSAVLVHALRRQLAAGGAKVDLIETHISWVLLAGDTAWKIKKPVRLGFLDFSSLAQRLHFCQEELRLNRRHAPDIYRDVVPITGTAAAPRLGGPGAAIEFALRMRRLAPRARLSAQRADGTLQPAHIDVLAERMADLHREAERAPADSPWGSAETVVGQMQALLDPLQAQGLEVSDLQAWLHAQAASLSPLWRQRQLQGWVRECHGDLHLHNAVVLPDTVTAFDCIEFEPALRWIDVQSDVAFLAMDLCAHGRPAWAWRFVNAWLDASGDHAGVPVLRFYMVYRALVRARVAGLAGAGDTRQQPAAARYLALARQLAFAPPPAQLLATHGLSGSGKSFVTQGLLEALAAVRLRSDVERKRLFGLTALQRSAGRVPGGIYGSEATQRTYARLGALAALLLRAGWPVIVDAACLRRAEREALRAVALAAEVPFTLLDCQADVATLRQRVQARLQRADDASEADLSVLEQQLGIDEPLTADEGRSAIVLRTDAALDLPELASRCVPAGPTEAPAAATRKGSSD
jgi:aminoglycoside phosphotransferase family enzyme/predicted kinase